MSYFQLICKWELLSKCMEEMHRYTPCTNPFILSQQTKEPVIWKDNNNADLDSTSVLVYVTVVYCINNY